MNKVAVILSGAGVFDGAEIQEAVFALLSLARAGVDYQCFAPDKEQFHVINHITGEEQNETRNVLIESARITRGDIQPISECKPSDFEGLVLPGGFGAAKNLCDFAIKGADCDIDAGVMAVCKAFAVAKKPAAYACIAPAIAASIYPKGTKMTIGTDKDTAAALSQLGASHVDCNVDDVVIDADAKVVTTPAYMLAGNITQAYTGIEKMINAFVALK